MNDIFWEKNAAVWSRTIAAAQIASRESTTPALKQCLLDLQAQSILDLGCGEGFLSSFCRDQGISYLGVDGSAGLIEIARKSHGDYFLQRSYEEMVAEKNSVAGSYHILLFNFSLFDENLTELLKNIQRYMVPGGAIIIQTLPPATSQEFSKWNEDDFKSLPSEFHGTMRWFSRTQEAWEDQFFQADLRIEMTIQPVFDAKPASIIYVLRKSS